MQLLLQDPSPLMQPPMYSSQHCQVPIQAARAQSEPDASAVSSEGHGATLSVGPNTTAGINPGIQNAECRAWSECFASCQYRSKQQALEKTRIACCGFNAWKAGCSFHPHTPQNQLVPLLRSSSSTQEHCLADSCCVLL